MARNFLWREQFLHTRLDVELGRVLRFPSFRRSFTVHGLWPNSREPGFLDMISNNDEDMHCTADKKFDLSWLSSDLMNKLNKIMPDLTRGNLMKHEWNKHGVCYLKLLNDKVNGANTKISDSYAKKTFIKYFETIVSLYDTVSNRFNLTKG
jgi:ribonuclease I